MFRQLVCIVLVLSMHVSIGFCQEPSPDDEETYQVAKKDGLETLQLQKFKQAHWYFDLMVRRVPQRSEGWYLRGITHTRLSELDKAIQDFSKAIELDPKHANAYESRANCLFAQNKYQAAASDYDRVAELTPDNQTIWNQRGESAFNSDRMITALVSFSRATELDPKNEAFWSKKGKANSELGHSKAAVEDYSKAIEIAPTIAIRWALRGFEKDCSNDSEAALADLDRAIELDPSLAFAYENRWIVLNRLGKVDAAERDWDVLMKLIPAKRDVFEHIKLKVLPIFQQSPAPKTSNDFINRGNAFYEQREYKYALCDFRRAAELTRVDAVPLFNVGLTLNNWKSYEAAIDAYQQAIKVDDRYLQAYFEIGKIYQYNLGNIDEALLWFDKVVELAPESAVAFGYRGAARTEKGDFQGALADLNQSLRLDPGYATTYESRGKLSFKQGSLDEAITDFDKAISLDLNSEAALRSRGKAKRAKKDYEGAISDFDAALKIHRIAATYLERGLAYHEMGKAKEAQQDFDIILKYASELKTEMEKEIQNIDRAKQSDGLSPEIRERRGINR